MSRRRAQRGPWRNRVEFWAIRLAEALFRALPERGARRLGRMLGYAGFWLDARHRRVATGNVQQALGCSPATARRIARDSFAHMGEMLAEMAWAPRWVRTPHPAVRAVWKNIAPLRAQLATGTGAILATGHLGNWEQTSFLMPLEGVPFSTISRPLDNPLLWAMLERRRRIVGQGIILKTGAARDSAREIKAGRCVAVIFDQRSKKNSITIPFFGRDALTTLGPAMLAARNRCPIFFCYTWRRHDGRHVFEFDPPMRHEPSGDLKADVDRIMRHLNDRLADAIRRHPEQYLWAHDRWRPPRDESPA